MSDDVFRRYLSLFVRAMVYGFAVAVAALTIQWYTFNEQWVETNFYPVATDYTFTDWQKDDQGRWSAVVYMNKQRGECVFVKGQVETVIGTLPTGEVVESNVTHVGDTTFGGNRPPGYQRLDQRYQIDNPEIVEGTVFNGSVLHRCHGGNVTVTNFGPFTVGLNGEVPILQPPMEYRRP